MRAAQLKRNRWCGISIGRTRHARNATLRRDEARKELTMSRVVVFEHLTLDGVMQAPGRPDEDRRGGFEHGGWATRLDPVIAGVAEEHMGATEALLFGRRTYEEFYSYWPNQTDNPFTEVLTNTRKYVASRTLQEPFTWTSSTLLEGDAAEPVIRLKQQKGKDLDSPTSVLAAWTS